MVRSVECCCFRITDGNLKEFERELHKDGFVKTPQILEENQAFGLAKKIDNVWQMHVRAFGNGQLKAEIEPRWNYMEHILTPSYSAHKHLEKLLRKYHINFLRSLPTPEFCLNPKIQKPDKLTDVKSFDANSILSLINKCDVKVQSLQDLKEIMRKFLVTISSMATIDLNRFVNLRMYKGKLRLRIACPLRDMEGNFCQEDCIPTISCIVKIMNHKIRLNHFKMPEKNICNFEFFEQR